MLRFLLTVLMLTPALAAEVRVPGSNVFYAVSKDAQGHNSSAIFLDELYTDTSKSYLSLRCIGGGYLASLSTKFELFSAGQRSSLDRLYTVTYQVGAARPAKVRTLRAFEVGGQLNRSALTFLDPSANAMIASGLSAGKTMRLNIVPLAGAVLSAPLNYTFPASGFAAAAQAVNGCR
ncbi:hypothetical protein [Deinococcus alpinitundrae]|uniref:hypothetical protein n=1 Tax=Deinococcus alpinitundrae TaxID=468913 RepID=UPI0013794DB4|nr:hypothetical protein [Deinococcus alpinitundrae]